MKFLYKSLVYVLIMFNVSSLHAGEGWFTSANLGSIFNGPLPYVSKLVYEIKDGKNDPIVKSKTYSNSYSEKLNFSAALGYEFYELFFRLELGYNNFYQKKDDKTEFSYSGPSFSLGMYYKINTYSRFIPYVGGGLGYYYREVSFTDEPYKKAKQEYDGRAMFHVALGLYYDISDDISIGIENKLMFRTGFAFSSEGDKVSYNFFSENQIINNISFSIKYYFW